MTDVYLADDHELHAEPVVRPDGEAGESESVVYYADDYEQITGRDRDGTVRDGGSPAAVDTKVVTDSKRSVSTSKAAKGAKK